MAYSKLHSSIVYSSLWTEDDSVRILFVTLMAIADREGCVYGSRFGLARIANIEPEDCEKAFDTLLSPDPQSCDLMRAPEHQGRRIEEIPSGFRLLNYEYYRGLRNDDDRREQNKQAQARYRERNTPKPESASVSQDKPRSAHAEAEADAEAKKVKPIGHFVSPTLEEVDAYCQKRGNKVDAVRWFNYYQSNGWKVGRNAMKNWKAAIHTWERGEVNPRTDKPTEPKMTPEEIAFAKEWNQKERIRIGAKHGQS